MFFGFDDDQLAFRDAVRDLLDKQCPPDVVRAAWDAPPGELDRGVWDALTEMGVPATLVLMLGVFIPPYLADWYRAAARLIGGQ